MHSPQVIGYPVAQSVGLGGVYSIGRNNIHFYNSKAQSDFSNEYLTFFKAIKDFKEIKTNWDSYGGLPPSDLAQNIILKLLGALFFEKILPTKIGLTPEGGILLEINNNKVYHLFEVYEDGEIVQLKKNQSGKITTENITDLSFSTVCKSIFYEIRRNNQLLRVGYSAEPASEWKTLRDSLQSRRTVVS